MVNNQRDSISFTILVAASAAAVAASASYVISRRRLQRQEDKLRAELHEQAHKQKARQAKQQKERGEPFGTKLPGLQIKDIYLWEVENLSGRFKGDGHGIVNKMLGLSSEKIPEETATFLRSLESGSSEMDESIKSLTSRRMDTEYNKLIGIHECIIADLVRKPGGSASSVAYVRAGPRSELHFNPRKVNAAIVTCGGLCPGLNNVIREITNSLFFLYGLEGKVYGIRGGYKGFYDPELPPVDLTPFDVQHIQHEGGTVLSSSRGGFDLDKTLGFIDKHNISQLYVIGGDGTHRGAFRIHEECVEKGMNVAVAGIPKTIDNDIDYIDRSFGFASAVEAAQAAIKCAKVEARCNLPNGVGIVKLMGRSAGFIAVHATMGSGDVDLCLVPEVPIVLEGDDGCLPHLWRRVKRQGFAVVVVAEGAGEELLGTSAEVDASGNKKLPQIGAFLKAQVERYFKERGEAATVKYIDPSYMIRSIPANASDSLYCMQLAQNAVHGAMAGFTGFSVGLCNNKMVFLPIPQLVATSPRMMSPRGRTWERVLALTRQPNTVPPLKDGEEVYDSHAPMLR